MFLLFNENLKICEMSYLIMKIIIKDICVFRLCIKTTITIRVYQLLHNLSCIHYTVMYI